MDIELRQLRILRAIADAGSLTRAAATLGMNQGSLSRHLQRLERTIGMPLMERTHTGVTPTSTGQLLLSKTERALGIVDQLLDAARNYNETTGLSIVRVGAVHNIVLPDVVRAVRTVIPDADMTLRIEDSHAEALNLLYGHESELAVFRRYDFYDPPVSNTIDHAVIVEEPTLLAMQESHPLASNESVCVLDLAECHCVLPDVARHQVSRYFVAECTASGVRPRVSYTTDYVAAAALVSGTGAVSPCYPTRTRMPDLVYRPMRCVSLKSQLVLAWSREGPLAPHAPRITRAISTAYPTREASGTSSSLTSGDQRG